MLSDRPSVVFGAALDVVDGLLQGKRQQILPADYIYAHPIVVEDIAFLAELQQFSPSELKQTVYLVLRAVEVVDSECVDRYVWYGEREQELEQLVERGGKCMSRKSASRKWRPTPFKASKPFS